MKERLFYLCRFFITITVLFIFQKPLFMLYNFTDGLSFNDYLQVMIHAFSLDASTAGYLTILPFIVILLSIWFSSFSLRKYMMPYYVLAMLLIAIIFVVDMALYPFWGFKLDATIFAYLDSPSEALASVSVGYVVFRTFLTLLLAVFFIWILYLITPRKIDKVKHRIRGTIGMLLLGGILFVVIRGGVAESTANIGQVYHSDNQFLNHASVNPAFSLLSSIGKSERFEDEYDFFPEAERAVWFEDLYPSTEGDSTTVQLLRTDRPNILVIMMEGFGGEFVESLGGVRGVSPNMDRLSKEGIWFTNFFTNSFRTDRGTLCTFSGYPGLPKTSVMKIPAKSQNLPSLARTLLDVGYETDFLYGGDINFTNMKSYLLGTGYQRLTADIDFSRHERKSNAWGVNDDITFNHLYHNIAARTDTTKRWHTGFLTLSSHEPFEVPFHRFPDDKVLNSFAYTDSCLGAFVDSLRQIPAVWDNLLIVCLPDHGILYRNGGITDRSDPRMYRAPMLWIGGAVREQIGRAHV